MCKIRTYEPGMFLELKIVQVQLEKRSVVNKTVAGQHLEFLPLENTPSVAVLIRS
jgi:hypothetical protein